MKWSDKEIEFLKANYSVLGAGRVAIKLQRSSTSVRLKAYKLSLKYVDLKHRLICKVNGCGLAYHAQGYCRKHYTQLYMKKNCKKMKRYKKIWNIKNRDRLRPIRKEYFVTHRAEFNEATKKFNRNYIKRALLIYGAKCQVCGCLDTRLLQFHHRKPNIIKEWSLEVARRIVISGKQDKNIMVVCANCHIKQNIVDGTSKIGLGKLRASKGIWITYVDKSQVAALNIYGCVCQNCGNKDPVVLEWHHHIPRRPRELPFSMFIRIRDNGKPVHDVLLLCANCHIIFDGQDKTCNRLRAAA